jgi:hypothetical protein
MGRCPSAASTASAAPKVSEREVRVLEKVVCTGTVAEGKRRWIIADK